MYKLFLFILLLIYNCFAYDWPKTIFEDQMETGDLDLWSFPSVSGNGKVECSDSITYSGKYSIFCNVDTNVTRNAYISKKFIESDSVYTRFYFYIPENINIVSGGDITFLSVCTPQYGTNLYFFRLRNVNNNINIVTYNQSSINIGTTNVEKGKWNYIQVKCKVGSGDGEISVWLNGILEFQNKTLTMLIKPSSVAVGIVGVLGTQSNGSLFVDDFVIDTTYIDTAKDFTLIYPDLLGRIGTKMIAITTNKYNNDSLSCYLFNNNLSRVFKTNIINKRAVVKIDFRNLESDTYNINLKIKGDNTLKMDSIIKFYKPYSGNPKYSIDEENNIIYNGNKFFPITCFGLDRAEIKDWVNGGYINMLYADDWSERFNLSYIPHYIAYLDSAEVYNIDCLGPSHDALTAVGTPIHLDTIIKLINQTKNHNANAWYMIREEPDNFGFKPPAVKEWWDLVKTHAPNILYENLLMGAGYYTKSEAAQWLTRSYHWPYLTGDIYSWDYYPIENPNGLNHMIEFVIRQKKAVSWNLDLIPTFPNVQTCDILPDQPTGGIPNPRDILFMCWSTIVHKAKGIHWYHYQGPTPTINFDAMAEFTTDVTNLTNAILGDSSDINVVIDTIKRSVDYMVKEYNDTTYIFAVNKFYDSVIVRFNLNGITNKKGYVVKSYKDNKFLKLNDTSFIDSLDTLGYKIYKIYKRYIYNSDILKITDSLSKDRPIFFSKYKGICYLDTSSDSISNWGHIDSIESYANSMNILQGIKSKYHRCIFKSKK